LESRVRGRKLRLHVTNRVTPVPAAPEFQRVWNSFLYDEPDIVFGDTCLFLPGDLQALLEFASQRHRSLAEELEALDIAEQRAPDGTEYLRGITYWAAIGDHFYQIQDLGLQAKAMEEYLTWLLRDQTKAIGPDHYVELRAEFDREQLKGDDVQSIQVGGVVPETLDADKVAVPKMEEFDAKGQVAELGTRLFAKGKKIIEDLVGEVAASKIIESIPEDASLEVVVNIGFRARRKRVSRQTMASLEAGLRNMPDGEIQVVGKNGVIKGNDARISAEMTVKRANDQSSLLNLEDALRQILEVHRRFLHDGLIEK